MLFPLLMYVLRWNFFDPSLEVMGDWDSFTPPSFGRHFNLGSHSFTQRLMVTLAYPVICWWATFYTEHRSSCICNETSLPACPFFFGTAQCLHWKDYDRNFLQPSSAQRWRVTHTSDREVSDSFQGWYWLLSPVFPQHLLAQSVYKKTEGHHCKVIRITFSYY